jgi:hypothetical protein
MVKLKAPMFSFGASGKLADAIVFADWKGIDLARKYVIPANPQTPAQVTQRGYMTGAVAQWHTVGADALEGEDKLAWNRYAGVLPPMSGFNAFTKEWMDERVAGGTPPGHFLDLNVTDADAAALALDVDGEGLTTENVTFHGGNSKTFFPLVDTDAAVAGVYTLAPLATGFAAGTRLYFYFDVGTPGTDFMRSGLYTALLT